MSATVLKLPPGVFNKPKSTRGSKDWNVEYFARELENLHTKVESIENAPAYSTTTLFGELAEGYELTIPIAITLEIFSDETIAILPTLEIYEEGNSEIEAVNNLKLELISLYEELNSLRDEDLGDNLRTHKRTINNYIRRD